MTPAARRDAVRRARRLGLSARRAYGLIGSRRSTCRRKPRRGDAPGLREALLRPAQKRPRFGRRRLHVPLRRELPGINHKRACRIYSREGSAVRRKQRKRLAREPRLPMPPASGPKECWSMDFTQDALESGRAFRTLNVVDVVTRMCLAIEVDTSLPAARVARVLDRLAAAHGRPRATTVDNGTEFTARATDAWAHAHGMETRFGGPGTPSDNPFIERFDDKVRGECLDQHWLGGLAGVRVTIENRRIDSNLNRPHSSLRNLTPCEFAAQASAGLRSAPPPSGPLKLEEPATL